MKNSKLAIYAAIDSLGIFLYTAGVAWCMFNGEKLFGKDKNFLMPMSLLLLLIFSVAVVGILFFGRPVHLYFNGFKKEGFKLLFYTLGFLFLMVLVAFGIHFLV